MAFELRFTHRDLQFKFDARTSRGSLSFHKAYYLQLSEAGEQRQEGWGEAAPLAGLSPDFRPDFETHLQQLCNSFNTQELSDFTTVQTWFNSQELENWPALRFGLETALLDFKNGGNRNLFDTEFTSGQTGIPINGLIWMGDESFMREQIKQKLDQGYTCLKLKIGSLDFDTELRILNSIRKLASPETLTIRVDANGAFNPAEALQKLEKLAVFHLHSIEQPIQPKQYDEMQDICAKTPVPVALDEELIGVTDAVKQKELLEFLKPQFIILKPTLVGGMQASKTWIDLAESQKIGWWIISALESNIGLNAVAQFTSSFKNLIPQGLGTGQLYHNNLTSPLDLDKGYLFYRKNLAWEMPAVGKVEAIS